MTTREIITINDVGPRDGLQNQTKHLSVDERLLLINALVDAGLPAIEVGAFVSPKAVPAMAGTDEVFQQLDHSDGVVYSALIPNAKGFKHGADLNVPLMSLVLAASSTMNEKNIRMTTAYALEMAQSVLELSKERASAVQAYVATAWECPFEGRVSGDEVLRLSALLLEGGASKIVIADTIGAADPDAVYKLMRRLANEVGAYNLSCHFHDTRGMGVANVYAAIEAGIRQFDASIGGLGGCPFAPGATGNVATEDVVLLVEQMGYQTGIDMPALLKASDLVSVLTGNSPGGRAKPWLKKNHSIAL
ncbi:hydroxymethylglutaryl-CoA lyase [Aestuariibacter sp. GS-14]|uniref:hydroxymethylglutaryl-CoA lyase n=1 Tax=Aestuariibacter sp. GS-14 TaxID=2590670 RepID=UPI00112B43C9|nr:hydroxymethylglutaryl-CoA lyase [Aestuariibacter sp. GS-14]TPV61791.1 hydroxymethylglutaryl-CoA lyase [Aestuariibacter sp. GS-14]